MVPWLSLELTGGKLAVEYEVKTPAGARTMGIDREMERIYLPTSEYEATPSGSSIKRPKTKAGGFMIVQVGA